MRSRTARAQPKRRAACLLLSLLCCLLSASSLICFAQTPSTPGAEQETAQPQAPTATPEQQATPERQRVTSYTLPPDKYEQAVTLSNIYYRLHFIGVGYSLLLLLLLLLMRVAPVFRGWAEAASGRRLVQAIIFVPLLLSLWSLLHLPLGIYGHNLQLRYGLSVQGWGSWFWDWAKGLLVMLVLGTLLVRLLLAVIRRSPRRWWLYFWLAMLPIMVFIVFIAPVALDPLFNRFEPLEPKQPRLVAELEKVVKRGGLSIPRERMFEMNASEKTRTLNAYVTGVGVTKRVVVWDTTIEKMNTAQTLFIFGHEMGHYVLGHILKGMAAAALGMLLLFFALYHAVRWVLGRRGERWAIRGADDWAALPLLMLFFVLFTFLAEPVANGFSRYLEHEADIYGLEVTHGITPDSAEAAAESFQVLGETSLSHPSPPAFVRFWLFSHPPIAERLRFAQDYDPWSKGQPRRFIP
ncbi:MAG TPA: M48 family metallopeptidase [Pyrinomonadaceae bacterium]|jgi:Zn-dependent protease with chaperone function